MNEDHDPARRQEWGGVNGRVERFVIQSEAAVEAGGVHIRGGWVAQTGTQFFDVRGDGEFIIAVQQQDGGGFWHLSLRDHAVQG